MSRMNGMSGMKRRWLTTMVVLMAFLLVVPFVAASPEEDQLTNMIMQIKNGIFGVQVRGMPCLNTALSLLYNRMDEMVGAQAFLSHISNPVTWARNLLLSFTADFAITAAQDLQKRIMDYTTKGGNIVVIEYSPGWMRRFAGDECKNFKLQFVWFKDENVVTVISSGECECDADLKDFYIQFDVHVESREDREPDAPNKYRIVGFSNAGRDDEYFLNPDDNANAIIKVSCCKKQGDTINWGGSCENEADEEDEDSSDEVGFSRPKSLFTDPDEFLAALESGTFVPTLEDRERFVVGTLCTRLIDSVMQTEEDIPNPIIPSTPDPVRTITPPPDPVQTMPPNPPPSVALPPTPPTLPPPIIPQQPRSCEEVCADNGRTTEQQGYSSSLIQDINAYTCARSARIILPEAQRIGSCDCYDPRETPSIEVDTTAPVCPDTFCGDVPCGEARSCEEPGAAYSAECRWEGWRETSPGVFVGVVDVW